jgi:hypothetical protein
MKRSDRRQAARQGARLRLPGTAWQGGKVDNRVPETIAEQAFKVDGVGGV